MLFTTMTSDELVARGIWQFAWSMLDSAVYMLCQGRGPKVTSRFKSSGWRSRDIISNLVGSRDFLSADEDYADVVIIQLHEDLRVELPPELRDRAVNRYVPERPVDAAAPLPPRARSLLAAAWRD